MNLTPSATKTIPHEAFYGTTMHKLAQQLQVFRCLAWVHVQQKDQQGKYGARAKPAIMIGYDDEHKAWKFYNPDQPASIQWSNSAMFHEDKGWSDRQQEAVWPVVTVEVKEEGCHGPGCSRSRRVMGSYGRSTGIEDLVDTSREHGRSAVSMETMDSYGLTCTATRRTKLKEQAQPRRGPSSRSMQMVTTQGLERQEPKELSLIKGGGAVSKESTPGHEEEEQCRRS
ncbi:hypothetical protein NDA10_001702 [Ustilago hordei]|nr:hypothetical protein NDA10_001702 [Ustilago hordei]